MRGRGGRESGAAAGKKGEASLRSTEMADEGDPTTMGDETWACTQEARTVFARLEEIRDT